MSESVDPGRAPYGSSTVDKALEILRAVGRSPAGLTNGEIGGQLGLDRSTAHRLVSTLQRNGFLLRDADRRYVIGPEVTFLAWGTGADLKAAMEGLLAQLSEESGESASYSTAFGDTYYCVAVRPGPSELNYHPMPSTFYDLHTSATGLAILAFVDAAEQDRLLTAKPLRALTERTVTDPGELREELELTRDRGYAVSAGTRVAGGCAIARPVFNGVGVVAGALTLSAAEQRVSPNDLVLMDPLLEDAAKRLSAAMGWRAGN